MYHDNVTTRERSSEVLVNAAHGMVPGPMRQEESKGGPSTKDLKTSS